ncbi:MAG: CDP-alcohol phosphatidyltransferase family protein [Magnetococcus sp. DMHC-6]
MTGKLAELWSCFPPFTSNLRKDDRQTLGGESPLKQPDPPQSPHPFFLNFAQFRRIAWQAEWQSQAYSADPVHWEQLYFSRPLSCRLTFLLYRTAITPNQVTFFWVLLTLLGGMALACPIPILTLAAPWFFWLAWILDHVDGELARVKSLFSTWGDFLDLFGHQLFLVMIFAGLTVRFLLQEGIPTFTLLCGVLATALAAQAEGLRKNVLLLFLLNQPDPTHLASEPSSETAAMRPTLRQFLALPHSEVGMLYMLMVSSLLGLESWYLIFYGVTLPLVVAIKWRARSRELQFLLAHPHTMAQKIRPEWLVKDVSSP